MNKKNAILQELEWRGLIFQVNNRETLEKELASGMVTLYQGFDPTADSLHIGNLLGLIMLKRFQLSGHRPVVLVGGGTGLIGDPSGRSSERQLNAAEVVSEWSEKLKKQTQQFVDFDSAAPNKALLVNNYDWLSGLSVIEFLRNVGKYFPINEMLGRESVSLRLEAGISYTEFSYMLLQSYDFLELFNKYNCTLQIGGSDQWGNIAAGASYIRKSVQKEAHVLTMPLVTTADGKKFGKSEGNAVWLDAKKTSPYHFYQFWLNSDDRDVIKLLKFYTFLSQEEILELESTLANNPEKREPHKRLASEVTKIVHGKGAVEKAERQALLLFQSDVKSLTSEDLDDISVGAYPIDLSKPIDILDFLSLTLLVSKRQVREDLGNGAICINDKVYRHKDDQNIKISRDFLLLNKCIIIRRGKKEFKVVVDAKALKVDQDFMGVLTKKAN